jgi:hypothetical protein
MPYGEKENIYFHLVENLDVMRMPTLLETVDGFKAILNEFLS